MHILRRLITLLLFSAVLFSAFPLQTASAAYEAMPNLAMADTVYFYHFESNTVIARKESSSRIAPASTVKIASGLLALEYLSDRLDENITITADMLLNSSGTSMHLQAGDILTVKDLLYGAICGGYNDAVYALAHTAVGNAESFVAELNKRLSDWGCSNSHYTNPTGVDENGMYTTLDDVITLSKIAMNSQLYMEISSVSSYSYTNYRNEVSTIHNRNAIISSHYYQGCQSRYAKGLIAGMTERGGYCVVTTARYENSSYLCIVMGAKGSETNAHSFRIAFEMLQYAFTQLQYTNLTEDGQTLCTAPVKLAMSFDKSKDFATVKCTLPKKITELIPLNALDNNEIEYRIYLHTDELTAPIYEGDVVGGVDIYYGEEWLCHSELVAAQTILENSFLAKMESIRNLLFSRKCALILGTFISILIPYLFISGKNNRRRRKTKKIEYKNYY